jgi:hypothetical protein
MNQDVLFLSWRYWKTKTPFFLAIRRPFFHCLHENK